jgi:hypothetical protein
MPRPWNSGHRQAPIPHQMQSGLRHACFGKAIQNECVAPLTGGWAALKPHPHRFGGPMRGRSSVG